MLMYKIIKSLSDSGTQRCWAVIPRLSELTLKIMETKKTWECVSSRAYPNTQAFALPLSKDKQRQACPRRDNIYTPRRRTSQGNVNDNLNFNFNDNANDKGNGCANHNQSIYAKRVHPLLAYTLLYI